MANENAGDARDARDARDTKDEKYVDQIGAGNVEPLRVTEADNIPCNTPSAFAVELKRLINRYSKEGGSNTPDFVLAKYLCNCLDAFNTASREREKHFGVELRVGRGAVKIIEHP